MRVPFVDAHVHLWDLGHIQYPWLTPPFTDDGPNGSVEAIARTYLPKDYLVDASGWTVAGLVHVDAGADPRDALAETSWLEGLGAQTGLPTAIIAFAALESDQVDAMLAAQASHPRVRGIRQILNWHGDAQRTYTRRDLTVDRQWQHGFGRLEAFGLSFDLQCYPHQMSTLAKLFARHPGTPVAINHAGMAVLSDPNGYQEWRDGMRALAACAHVSVKLSGFGFVRRDWNENLVRPMILDLIDMFGTDRCMFASDFPTDKLFGSFDRHLDAYETIIAGFSIDERRAMFGGNADRFYRLGLGLGAIL